MKAPTSLFVLAALFAGAVLSHYVGPQSVLAQTPPAQAQSAPKDIRAQQFTFVNDKNEVQAVLSVQTDRDGRPTVVLADRNGREMWAAGGSPLRPLAMK